MVQKLSAYEQRHPDVYQDKFKRVVTMVDAGEDEVATGEQEVAVAEWTRAAGPVTCKWVKPPGPPRGFDFDVTKTEQIFDLLLAEKHIKIPECHKVPTHRDITLTPYNDALAIIPVEVEPDAVVAVADDLPADHVEPFDEDVVHNVQEIIDISDSQVEVDSLGFYTIEHEDWLQSADLDADSAQIRGFDASVEQDITGLGENSTEGPLEELMILVMDYST
nr:uncharacterized protein LOC127303473 [Lolium perenne]